MAFRCNGPDQDCDNCTRCGGCEKYVECDVRKAARQRSQGCSVYLLRYCRNTRSKRPILTAMLHTHTECECL